MPEMTLPEVLAHVYLTERGTPLSSLSIAERSSVLGAMTEVVRALKYFEAEGMVVVRSLPSKAAAAQPTIVISPGGSLSAGYAAKIRGFTGILCDVCGSPNTVRIGKCLRCEDCRHDGECG